MKNYAAIKSISINVICLIKIMDKQLRSWTVKTHTVLLVYYSADVFQQLIVMKLLA